MLREAFLNQGLLARIQTRVIKFNQATCHNLAFRQSQGWEFGE